MKRLFIWIVLCCFGTLTAQTTLTFTGKDNLDNYVQLHHVVVENLTQNWADTLYYPDTILILSGAGLNDYENVSAFSLSQNVPNPFDGVTDFTMALPCEDKVVIEVFDMAGKRVTGTTQRLSAGKHTFRVWLNRPQAYLLSVKTGRDVLSIKMVNRGGRNDDRIAYLQESPLTYELKSARDGDYPFTPGDVMRYTGYALHDSSFVQSATIEQPVHEDELFELAFHLWEFVEQDGHFIDTNTLFIPDGQPCNGSCLGSMHFQVSGYPFGQTVQSEEDIQFLRLKMEHSYMGDLWISLSCPNGQSATLLKRYSYNSTSGCSNEVSAANSGWQQEGFGKAKLGQYNTDDGYDKCDPTLNPMGTCWNYCWSCDTSHYYVYTCGSAYLYDTCNLIAAGNNIYYVDSTDMASMTNVFRPDESFSSLIGCPLNGLWKVNIVDSWSLDNGYVEEAEIALPTFSEYLAAHKPTVVTGSSGSISYYTAVCGGDVLDDGFLPVTARGICWDTIPEPTTAGPHTVEGTGKGNFASTLANLEAGTTYHFRAYAVNDLGTSYGVTKSFTTLANTTPAVTTMNVTGITGISAMAGGIVTDDGGLAVSERGICWATHPDPTVDDQVMYFTTPADTFSSEISGLSNNTTYRVRAFARNALGIAYGANKTFKTHYPPTITLTSSETTNTSVTVSHSISTPATITSDGVCWSLSSNFSDDTCRTYSHTTNTLNHNHSTTITGLVPGTTYYLQAFAENVAGLAYSNSLAITTDPLPVVVTDSVTILDNNTAECWGHVVYDGGLPITDKGICWNTTGNPTLSDLHLSATGSSNAHFVQTMNNLFLDTIYHVRAYAINSFDTAYGEVIDFVTRTEYGVPCPGDTTVTDIDGNLYHTVLLGTQCWMKENMRTTHFRDSTAITLNIGSYRRFYPAGDSSKVTKYGYLYTLTTAGRSTFCPPGWHLPSKADWDTLFSYVGSQTQYRCGGSSANIAKALASTTGWSTGDYSSVGGCAPAGLQVTNNETGFTAMPAGELLYFIGDEGVTEENSDFGTMASFWSGTAKYIHVGSFTFLEGYHYFWLTCNSATTHNDVCGASEARSARCVRNQ